MIRYKPADRLERSFYFQIAGFLIFFWLMSFRGHVEPHWTIACSIPVILLLSNKCLTDPSLFRFTQRFILPSIVLLIIIRILMMTDIRFVRNIAFGGKEKKYKEIVSEAKDLPVIFTGAFQRPSLYTFFTGNEAMAISSIYSRQTQFDLWQFEKKYHNKPVFICLNQMSNSQIYVSDTAGFGGYRTDSLQTVNRMKITFDFMAGTFLAGDSVKTAIKLYNPYDHDINFVHRHFPVEFFMVYIKGKEINVKRAETSEPVYIVASGETIERTITAEIPDLPPGMYNYGICLNTIFGPSPNSRFVRIKIGKDD